MGVSSLPEQVEDEREVVTETTRKHTSGMDVDVEALTARVESALTLVDDIKDSYERWASEVLSPSDVLGLMQRLPQKDLPDWMPVDAISTDVERVRQNDQLPDYLSESIVGDTETKVERVVDYHMHNSTDENAVTRWQAYNDVTESIWHDSDTNDDSKKRKFKQLHRTLEPAENVR